MEEFVDIQSLVKLFNPPKNDDSDCELEDVESSTQAKKSSKKATVSEEDKIELLKNNPYTKISPEKTANEEIAELLAEDNLQSDTQLATKADWKRSPKWEVSYRQKVTASDVFLQMGAKNPSTASCENMIISVDLPGEHMQNIDIKLLKDKVEINSPNFYLNLPLPQPVDPKQGNAKWESTDEKLIITLEMQRELDFINF